MFQFFLPVHSETALIVGTKEFEPLVIFSSYDSDLCWTLAVIFQRALQRSDPLFSSRVVILCAILLPEGNISWTLAVARSLHQAALRHKFLHESVNFMNDLCGLQHGIFSSGPPLAFSVFVVSTALALLACRLVEIFLNIFIRFGFGFCGIRAAMAGPVIAIGLHGRGEAGRRRGSIFLVI